MHQDWVKLEMVPRSNDVDLRGRLGSLVVQPQTLSDRATTTVCTSSYEVSSKQNQIRNASIIVLRDERFEGVLGA